MIPIALYTNSIIICLLSVQLAYANNSPQGGVAIDRLGLASGQAFDPDEPDRIIGIHFYVKNPDDSETYVQGTNAPLSDHGFEWQVPDTFKNGTRYTFRAYGIDTQGGPSGFLGEAEYQNISPKGQYFPISSDGTIHGWAYDPDEPTQTIGIHFYIEGIGLSRTYLGYAPADQSSCAHSPNDPHGPGHCFLFHIPDSYRNGHRYAVFAYGLDRNSGRANAPLIYSPLDLTPEDIRYRQASFYFVYPANPTVVPPPSSLPDPQKLRAVTYNVFGLAPNRGKPINNEMQLDNRLPAILKTLADANADVIALQEATPEFVAALRSNGWLKPDNNAPYDLVYCEGWKHGLQCLLSKYPVVKKWFRRFGDPLGDDDNRGVAVAQLSVGSDIVTVASVHLLWRGLATDVDDRRMQVVMAIEEMVNDQIASVLSGQDRTMKNAILLGDFNFGDDDPEQPLLTRMEMKESLVDIWRELKLQDPGFTYDVKRNTNANTLAPNEPRRRLDRVIYRSNTWTATSINHLGTNSIPESHDVTLFPSDHFGLMATFKKRTPQIVTDTSFTYQGGGIDGFDWKNVFWEPSADTILSAGFHVAFYGRPDPASHCSITRDGITSRGFVWADSAVDTGIPDGSNKWAPECNGWQGVTYARVHESIAGTGGGIGLYTHAGPKPWDPSGSFWMPYTESGDRNGANRFIEGSFAIFRFTPDTPVLVRPWIGNSQDNKLRRAAFITKQGVVKAGVGPKGTTQSQIQQKIQFTVVNTDCLQTNPTSPIACQFQMLAYTAVVDANRPYLNMAAVYADPSQGGIPVIFGPILTEGQSTIMACPNYGCNNDVWTSWANSTQHASWSGQKTFQIEISFDQLMKIVSVTTAQKKSKSIPTVADIKELYGPTYADPKNWALLDVGFSQEVYNEYQSESTRVFIGGNMTELRVIALPYY